MSSDQSSQSPDNSQPGKFAVVSTMKNEGPFILEWVAHYKALGFDYVVVCTNDCEDTTVEILLRLQEMGFVLHRETIARRGGLQRSAIRQGISLVQNTHPDCEWYMVCDADEFLNIHFGDGSVRALVDASAENADCICIPWRVFVPNASEHFEDVPLSDKLDYGELPYHAQSRPDTGKFVKSLFRNLERYRRYGLHLPQIDLEADEIARYVLPGGLPYLDEEGDRTSNPPLFDGAQINHYALRSIESFLVKRDRGRMNHIDHVLGVDYWKRFDIPAQKDDSIKRYKLQRNEYIAEFKSDAKLAHLHAQAVDWHQKRAEELMQDPENEQLVSKLRNYSLLVWARNLLSRQIAS